MMSCAKIVKLQKVELMKWKWSNSPANLAVAYDTDLHLMMWHHPPPWFLVLMVCQLSAQFLTQTGCCLILFKTDEQ